MPELQERRNGGDLQFPKGVENCSSFFVAHLSGIQVNSTDTFLSPVPPLEYPYANAGSNQITNGMTRSGSLGSMAPTTSFQLPSQTFREPSTNVSSLSSRSSSHAFQGSYGVGYNEDAYDNHRSQQPSYLLPPQEPHTPVAGYSNQDFSRHWAPIAGSGRVPNSMGFENEQPSGYAPPNFPYSNPSAMTAMPSEGLLPTASPLARSLPRGAPNGDRTLPNPALRSFLEGNHSAYPEHSGESTSHGLPTNLSYRSSVAWGPEFVTQGGGLGSSASLGSISGSITTNNTSTSPPIEQYQRNAPFGYIELPNSPLPAPVTSTSEINSTNAAVDSVARLAQTPYNESGQRHSAIEQQEQAPLYTYSLGSVGRSSSMDSKVVSGQTYTQLPHESVQPPSELRTCHAVQAEQVLETKPKLPASHVGQARHR